MSGMYMHAIERHIKSHICIPLYTRMKTQMYIYIHLLYIYIIYIIYIYIFFLLYIENKD